MKKPKFVIKTIESPDRKNPGFSVQVFKRTIEEARPFCNGTRLDWIEKDGTRLKSKTLYARDPEPSFFYPFIIRLPSQPMKAKIRIVGKGAEKSKDYELSFKA